jgi:hypothetical protein
MKKNIILLLVLCSTYSHLYTNQFEFQQIETGDLRPGTPTDSFPDSGDLLDLNLQQTREFAGGLLKGLETLNSIETFLADTNTETPEFHERGRKQGARGALLGTAVIVPVILAAGTANRSPESWIIAASAVGIGACATGGIGWMLWGNYMKIIINFKENLQGALGHMGELKGHIAELQRRQGELEGKTTEILKFSQQALDRMSVVKEVSGDNARLASVMQLLMERQEKLEKQLLQVIGDTHTTLDLASFKGDTEEPELFFSSSGLTQLEKKKAALAEYNRTERDGFFQSYYKKFSKVPKKWLTEHNFSDIAS